MTLAIYYMAGTDPAPFGAALDSAVFSRVTMDGALGPDATGLLVAGGGGVSPDVVPAAISDALKRDLPVLAIGSGMHVLNVALGGKAAVAVEGHARSSRSPAPRAEAEAGPDGQAGAVALGRERRRSRADGVDASPPGKRQVFLPPGAKLSYTIGGSGWVTVPDEHSSGFRDAEKAPGVLACAYAHDGVIEAIELPGRHWVIGVEWPAHLGAELPKGFDNLWLAFLERAQS